MMFTMVKSTSLYAYYNIRKAMDCEVCSSVTKNKSLVLCAREGICKPNVDFLVPMNISDHYHIYLDSNITPQSNL